MGEHYSLAEIVSQSRAEQRYLAGHPENTQKISHALRRMGLGDRFEFVGCGDAALVISPEFNKEIVIRLGTEYEEPGFSYYNPLKGTDEKIFRPEIPQVLQAIHTEKVLLAPNPGHYRSRTTNMRIEVLPRLQTVSDKDKQSTWEKYGDILQQELRACGYDIGDPKSNNIGLLPNRTRSPVILDPGEITHMGKNGKLAKAGSALRHYLGGGYHWSFSGQTEHLKVDWKKHITEHMRAYDAELDGLLQRMLEPGRDEGTPHADMVRAGSSETKFRS